MEEILNNIHSATSGTGVILGSTARFLRGYYAEPSKKWIDISIRTEYIDNVRALGRPFDLQGGTSAPSPVKDQFIVKLEDRYFLDVFVNDEEISTTSVRGYNVITEQADLDWHVMLKNIFEVPELNTKVEMLQLLYNL